MPNLEFILKLPCRRKCSTNQSTLFSLKNYSQWVILQVWITIAGKWTSASGSRRCLSSYFINLIFKNSQEICVLNQKSIKAGPELSDTL